MRDHLLFYLNGQPVRVTGDDAFLTLAEFLRRRRGLTGTKVVCAEGDCGSCAVLVGRVDQTGIFRYAAVTSCIQFLFQLDAAHVVTVEGLRDDRELNPIQRSMVDCHGTQCGFCTPGFVVALYELMHEGRPLDDNGVRRGLVGNLCRCTGYDSIVRAALATDRDGLKSLESLFPSGPIAAALAAADQEVRIESPAKRFYKPTSIERAVCFHAENPDGIVVAGATDMGVVYNKRLRSVDVALSLAGLAELQGIRVDAGAIYAGSCATLTALEQTAITHFPEFGRFLARFGSPLIKNAGTLGGNLVTASPIGDTIPALMVLDAQIDLAGVVQTRRVPISRFYAGYRQTVLSADELVTGIHIPLPGPNGAFRLYKVSRRKDLDISSFSAAVWTRCEDGVVSDVRIAFGGVGPMVLRPSRTEAALRGHAPSFERFEQAAALAYHEVTPITDVRGSEQYRRTLAANILLKFWHDTFAGQDGGGNNGHPPPNGDGRFDEAAANPRRDVMTLRARPGTNGDA